MTTNYRIALDRRELEALCLRLPARNRRRFETDQALADMASSEPSTDELVVNRDRQALSDRIASTLRASLPRFDPQDQLILRLRFDDGRTVPEIASSLGLEQKRLYRRLERLLRGLRVALEAAGISASDANQVLESSTVTFEIRDRAAESSAGRPSIGEAGCGR
jgi:RNA polymerase sigma factor (sigma-70 family)